MIKALQNIDPSFIMNWLWYLVKMVTKKLRYLILNFRNLNINKNKFKMVAITKTCHMIDY